MNEEQEKILSEFIKEKTDDLGTLAITDSPSEEYLKSICEDYFALKLRLIQKNVTV